MNAELFVYEELAKAIYRRVDADVDPAELQNWLSDRVTQIGGHTEGNALLTWQESFEFYRSLRAKRKYIAQQPPEQRTILDWPWSTWNSKISPLKPGMLATISAPDGAGKSLYAECIAEHWARHRNRVVFVHYELNQEVMMDRRYARNSKIRQRELESGELTDEQNRVLDEVDATLGAWEGFITYLHTPGWDIDRTILNLRQRLAEQECDVVIIDYLEKVAPSARQLRFFGSNVFQREADNVEQIKNFAESASIPVLMLAQMSKQGKQQDGDKVDRMDMRGAGEKSEKSNLVVLLSRKQTPDGYSNEVLVTIDKNTMGPTAKFRQTMVPEFFDVQDTAHNDPPPHWSNS